MLQIHLTRYKSQTHKPNKRCKIEKSCYSRQKESNYISEAESLKLDNMTLNAKFIEQQDKITTMAHKLDFMKEEESLKILKTSIKRDYLHTILQDNSELNPFDLETKRYYSQTRQCIMILQHNISSENVGPVIKEVLNLANINARTMSSPGKLLTIYLQRKLSLVKNRYGQHSLDKNMHVYMAMRQRNVTRLIKLFLLSDENKNVYFLWFRDMLS